MRPALRLLPLPFTIALCLPAFAADDKPDNWDLCPIHDAIPSFEGNADDKSAGNAIQAAPAANPKKEPAVVMNPSSETGSVASGRCRQMRQTR